MKAPVNFRHAATFPLILAILSGCKEEKKAPPPAAASEADRVLAATEQSLRAGGWPQMQFRGVRVYAQARPQQMAVCGQLDPFADDPNLYVPFVSLVTVPLTPGDGAAPYAFDHVVGKTTSEASRVYVAIVNYCWDNGGPAAGPYRSVMPVPPLPDPLPDPSGKGKLILQMRGAPPPVAGATAAAIAASPATAPVNPALSPAASAPALAAGIVTMRQNANLHSDPHGPTVRVVAQGTPMHVFAQAPGGWYQVGDTAPWGWVHESMLEQHP